MATNQLAALGAMLADNTRAEMLAILMDGRAHTGGELARSAGVSASTASEHLSKLLDAQLVAVAAQGRHRYFRLAGVHIAELLEMLGTAPVPIGQIASPRAPAALLYARTCYDHLAGELAVTICERLIATGMIEQHPDHLVLTDAGGELFAGVGADVATARATKRATVRCCLDWTERRHHLAGSAAAALLDALFANKWLTRGTVPRSVRVTERGRVELPAYFDLADALTTAG